MDVGDPSNFIRILEIFNHDYEALAACFSSVSISDEETKKAIYETEKNTGYLLDPHGAVGYLALKNYLQNHVNEKGFFAETAHPVKFYDVVEPVINKKILLPDAVAKIIDKEKIALSIDADFKQLKSFLMSMKA
jgi:threonine synthase